MGTHPEASCSGSATDGCGSWFGEQCDQRSPPSTPTGAGGGGLRKCASTPTLHSMSAVCGEGEGMEVFVALRAFKVSERCVGADVCQRQRRAPHKQVSLGKALQLALPAAAQQRRGDDDDMHGK